MTRAVISTTGLYYDAAPCCAECRGECCKRYPGAVWPQDVQLLPGEQTMGDALARILWTGGFTFDWWEGDPRRRLKPSEFQGKSTGRRSLGKGDGHATIWWGVAGTSDLWGGMGHGRRTLRGGRRRACSSGRMGAHGRSKRGRRGAGRSSLFQRSSRSAAKVLRGRRGRGQGQSLGSHSTERSRRR